MISNFFKNHLNLVLKNDMISNSYYFTASNNYFPFWIFDFETTNHMTNIINIFQTYKPYPINKKIKITAGSIETIVGQEDISIFSNLGGVWFSCVLLCFTL